jgi:hypothetical protein
MLGLIHGIEMGEFCGFGVHTGHNAVKEFILDATLQQCNLSNASIKCIDSIKKI